MAIKASPWRALILGSEEFTAAEVTRARGLCRRPHERLQIVLRDDQKSASVPMPQPAETPTMASMAWTANTSIGADPGQVMDVLTRPCAISSWAPVPFEVEGLGSDRLQTGSRARVAGMLGGRELAFDIEVHEASDEALRLTAAGPFVEMDVVYGVFPNEDSADVHASIDVKGKGIMGRFVAKAVEGFLAGGALKGALAELAFAAENTQFEYQHAALAA
jgi:hypothetical protein